MHLAASLQIALKALAANKLRSLLTMLGIIIGVFAVVLLVSTGRGVQQYVSDIFMQAGTNVLFVIPGALDESGAPGQLTQGDAQAIRDPFNVDHVDSVVTELNAQVIATRGANALRVTLMGIWPEHAYVRGWEAVSGSYLAPQDMDNRARVAMLGQGAYARLYEAGDYPIGSFIKVDNKSFEVIGIMEEMSAGMFGDLNDSVFIPFTTMQDRILRRKTVSGEYLADVIVVKVDAEDNMPAVQVQIEELLRQTHRLKYFEGDDFSVISMSDFLNIFQGVTQALTAFLGIVSAISLVVGGIGIMNIMLVSVTERTREIGLRKAIGARPGTIMWQFIVEALAISLLGGLVGVGMVTLAVLGLNQTVPQFTVSLEWNAIVMGVGFCAAVGLVFGFYPAFRASRLKPIEALRYQ